MTLHNYILYYGESTDIGILPVYLAMPTIVVSKN